VEGQIRVNGGTGRISLSSVEGEVALSNASGRISISSVDGDVILQSIKGDLQVSAVDGAVRMDGVDATNVDVSTVDGEITYTGAFQCNGRYRLNSHDGDVTVTIPSLDAAVSVVTYEGDFESDFEITINGTGRRKKLDFTVGKGCARLELESFDGSVRLRKGSGSGRRP
jgi:DUF4097 and DUF4098 domain-containing protein YvlB